MLDKRLREPFEVRKRVTCGFERIRKLGQQATELARLDQWENSLDEWFEHLVEFLSLVRHLLGDLDDEREILRYFLEHVDEHERRGYAVVGGVNLRNVEPLCVERQKVARFGARGIDGPYPILEAVAGGPNAYLSGHAPS